MARNHLRVPKSALTDFRLSRHVVVDITQVLPTCSASQLCAPSSKAPVIQSLKEWEAFVLLLLAEVGLIHCREGHCAFVAGFEVCLRWIQELVAKV